jgi:hypothetical protein
MDVDTRGHTGHGCLSWIGLLPLWTMTHKRAMQADN